LWVVRQPAQRVFNYISKRWGSGGGHGDIVQIPDYRKPVVPPNRPLAFFLASTLILFGIFSTTGFFLYPAPPTFSPDVFDVKREEDKLRGIDDVIISDIGRNEEY